MKPPHSHRPSGGSGRPPSDRGPANRGPGQGTGGPQRSSGGQGQYQGSGRGPGQGGRALPPNRHAQPGAAPDPARHGPAQHGPAQHGPAQRGPTLPGPTLPGRVYHSDAPHQERGPGSKTLHARPPQTPLPPVQPPQSRSPQIGAPRGQGGGPRREDRSAPPPTPRGAVWLYGYHAVAAALGNPARRLRRLILTEEAEATLATHRPQPWSIAAERMDRAGMDRLLGRDAVHQGVALLADSLAPPQLASVLERPGPILVLDQVTDPRNIGAILRSAAAFDVAGVITQDRNAPEETGAMAKAAAGAMELVPLIRAVNISRTLIVLKAAGLWVVGLDASGQPLTGAALAGRRIALVLGAEGEGMRRLTRETCDEVAGLTMPGVMESLNVSAAAAVALYELGRPT